MAGTTITINDVYKNTEELKTKVNEVSQKVSNEEASLKDLKEQVRELNSPPMIG